MGVRSKRADATAGQTTPAGGGTQQGARGGQPAGSFLKGGRRAGNTGSGAANGSGKQQQSKSTTAWFVELIAIVAIAVLLAFGIQAFIVKPYRIPSGSMEPTLTVGQRVLVNRFSTNFSEPHIGEIVVFHPPEGTREEQCGATPRSTIDYGGAACDQTNPHESSENFIKRVVAGPGDTIKIEEGHVYLKTPGSTRFVREHDSYIKPCGGVQECNFPTPITIPAGHWFMMGDNRGNSDDSRFWGPVPRSWIIGGAFFTYWPPDRIGTL